MKLDHTGSYYPSSFEEPCLMVYILNFICLLNRFSKANIEKFMLNFYHYYYYNTIHRCIVIWRAPFYAYSAFAFCTCQHTVVGSGSLVTSRCTTQHWRIGLPATYAQQAKRQLQRGRETSNATRNLQFKWQFCLFAGVGAVSVQRWNFTPKNVALRLDTLQIMWIWVS